MRVTTAMAQDKRDNITHRRTITFSTANTTNSNNSNNSNNNNNNNDNNNNDNNNNKQQWPFAITHM